MCVVEGELDEFGGHVLVIEVWCDFGVAECYEVLVQVVFGVAGWFVVDGDFVVILFEVVDNVCRYLVILL